MVFNISLRFSVIGILLITSSIQCHKQNNEHQHRQTIEDLSTVTTTVRCGTKEPTPEIGAETAKIVKSWEEKKISDGWRGEKLAIDVNVYFHNIEDSLGNGSMTQTDLTNSLVVLNEAFRDFNFIQAGATVTINDYWFRAEAGASSAMFESLRQGGRKDLNVYFHDIAEGIIGYASVPWNYWIDPVGDGVVIHYQTIPGGILFPYDEGDTLVHEVGHWLGLLHTFTVTNYILPAMSYSHFYPIFSSFSRLLMFFLFLQFF